MLPSNSNVFGMFSTSAQRYASAARHDRVGLHALVSHWFSFLLILQQHLPSSLPMAIEHVSE
jgi:hypothetical protein